MSIWQIYRCFGIFLGTGRFLDTAFGHRMIHFYWKHRTRINNFWFCSFRLLFSKTKVSRSLWNVVSFIPFMCIICIYRLKKRVWVF